MVRTPYLEKLFNSKLRRKVLTNSKRILKNVDFDTIYVTGVSGLGFGAILANTMKKELLVLRKKKESSHSNYEIEGCLGKKLLIVDDFVCTGDTHRRLVAAFHRHRDLFPPDAQIIGAFQYSQNGTQSFDDWRDE